MTRVPVPPGALDAVAIARLMAALDEPAGATRYVGGWVRDTLLGLDPQDIDLATIFPPQQVIARLDTGGLPFWTTPSGLAHGTVTAMVAGHPVEVTTLRRDVATDGRHAEVAFTDDWQADAARRDFTINALSADPGDGTVHDHFGGLDDLAARLVRFIGDPLVRIAEDHLRILRFFRFHARFGRGDPDQASLAACTARANDLMALSRERIATELLKLLALPAPVATVALMVSGGVLTPVLPEIDARGVTALAALVAAETASDIDGDPLRRLAALLPTDPATTEAIGRRLKLSKAQVRRLVLAATHDPGEPATALAYRIGHEAAVDRLLLTGDDPAVLAGWTRPVLGLSGGDLIAMGLPAGPIVAATLQAIERDWIAAGFPDGAAGRIAREKVDQAVRARQ